MTYNVFCGMLTLLIASRWSLLSSRLDALCVYILFCIDVCEISFGALTLLVGHGVLIPCL